MQSIPLLHPIPLFDPCGADDHSSVPTAFRMFAARSGEEGVFSGDPSAGSEATEDGVEHPLPRSEYGGGLGKGGDTPPRGAGGGGGGLDEMGRLRGGKLSRRHES